MLRRRCEFTGVCVMSAAGRFPCPSSGLLKDAHGGACGGAIVLRAEYDGEVPLSANPAPSSLRGWLPLSAGAGGNSGGGHQGESRSDGGKGGLWPRSSRNSSSREPVGAAVHGVGGVACAQSMYDAEGPPARAGAGGTGRLWIDGSFRERLFPLVGILLWRGALHQV